MLLRIKRLLAVVLAAVILFSNVPMDSVLAEASDLIIEDDFSSGLSQWKNESVGSVADGVYKLGNDMFNMVKVSELENAVISADVSVTYDQSANQMASVLVAADDTAANGYEFGIGIAQSGDFYARLYLRGNEENSLILYQVTEDIPGTPYGKIESGETYNIQLGVKEGQIRCLINGKVVCSINDTTYTKGNVGIKSKGDTAAFDNVKLSRIGEKTVQSISLLNTPETAAVYSLLEFDVVADCGDYFGTEIISSTHKDVKITGFDNTAGTKTVTVTYGGKSANFTLEVTEKFQSTTLLTQKFTNEAEITANFPLSNPSLVIDYHWEISDNKLFAKYPTSVGDFNSVAQMSSTLKTAVLGQWPKDEPYEIILNTAIHTKAITQTKRTAFTGLSFAKDDATGGEYLITVDENGLVSVSCTDTGWVLQKNNINLYDENLEVELGKDFQLRVQVCDSVMRAFYNQSLVCVVPLDIDETSPHLRLRAGNGTVSYSDLTVQTIQIRDYRKANKIELKKVNDRTIVSKVIGSEIDLSLYYLDVTYPDGVVQQIIPMENMLSGYTKGKNSTVTVTCGNAETTFEFEYVSVLFTDTFDDSQHPGWTRTNNSYFTQTIADGVLNSTFHYTGTLASDYFTVTNGSEWTDYTVSADFSFAKDTKYNSYTSAFNLVFRYQNSQNYYAFKLEQEGNSITGYLTMYKDSLTGGVNVATFKTERIAMVLDAEKSLSTGETYNIAVTCIGNTFFIYFEGDLIYVYTDKAENALMHGTAGMRHQNFTGTVDNFQVVDESQGIESITVTGTEDNVFEIYEGGEIEPNGIDVILNNRNGSKIAIPLKAEMISAYDNMELGRQNINIITDVYVGKAEVVVKQRHNYIEELKADLEELQTDDLTVSDKDMIEALQDRFDVLTPYEVFLTGEKAVANLKAAGIALDAILYAGVSESDSMIYETMDAEVKWEEDFASRSVGVWNRRNGYLAESQKAYHWYGAAFALHPTYGRAVTISADIMRIENDESTCAIMMNRNAEGYYYLRVLYDADDRTHEIQLRRMVGSDRTIVAKTTIENYGLECKAGEWFNLTMTYVDGVLRGYYNGMEVISYDDSNNQLHFTEGYNGFYMAGNDFCVDNLRVYGTTLEEPGDVYVEPVKYTDNFEDETAGTKPSHWIEPASQTTGMENNYKVYSLFGTKVYGTQKTSGNTMSYLHVFDKDTTWESDFYVGSSAEDGTVGYVFRMAPESTFVKVGYSFADSRWFVYQERNDGSEATVTKSDKTYSLAKDTKHTIKIAFKDANMVLTVDGAEVISHRNEEIVCDGYGRVGIYTQNAQMYIDNVNITLACGVAPNDGVLEYLFDEPATGYSATQVIDMGDGLMISIVNKGKHAYRSRDWGETWEDITLTDGAELLSIQNGYPEILKLSNGKYISVRSASYEVYVSDDMLHWELLSQVQLPYKYDELGRKYVDKNNRENSMHHINSLLEFNLPDGTNRVMLAIGVNGFADDTTQTRSSGNMKTITYYSDDYGKTWTASENDTTAVDLGYVDENNVGQWGESKLLLCSDGVLRMYNSRSYSSYLVYTESHDYGVTWSGLKVIPEIQIPVASLSIEEDPYDPGVYYMAWVNNVPAVYSSGSPRIRLSLARSTDGVNWKYLTDVERMIKRFDVDRENTTWIYQVIDPSITITEEHIYVNYGRSQRVGDASLTGQAIAHGQVGRRYTKLVKANLTEKEWSSASIADVSLAKTMKITKNPTLKFVKGDIFTLADGEVTITTLDGKTSTRSLKDLTIFKEPDMSIYGKQTVLLYDRNYMQLTVDIEIVDKYDITWNIIGEGEIETQKTSILEGDDYTFTLKPGGKVTVNGEEIQGKKGCFTIMDVRENLEITVEFSEEPEMILGNQLWPIPGITDITENATVDTITNSPVSSDKALVSGYWNTQSYSLYYDGTLAMKANRTYTGKLATGTKWSNYMFESDVKLSTGVNNARHVGLIIYASDGSSGYGFGISNKYASLFDMSTGNQTIDSTNNPPIASVERGYIDGETYHLSIAVYKGTIYCYIDGELVITQVIRELSDSFARYEKGSIGFGGAAGACYTNYKATQILSFGEETTTNKFTGMNLSLDGNIGFNFYVDSNNTLSNDAYLEFVLPTDGTQTVTKANATEVNNGLKFTCLVPAKEMTDTVVATLYDGGNVIDTKSVSVQDYAGIIIAEQGNNAEYEAAVPLIESMLQYGAYAQQLLKYNTGNLANSILTFDENTLFAGVNTESIEGAYSGTDSAIVTGRQNKDGFGELAAASLILEGETTLRMFFTFDSAVNPETLTFTVNGVEQTPIKQNYTEGTYYIVEVQNIAAKDLDANHTVIVTDGTAGNTLEAKCSAMTFCYKALSNIGSAEALQKVAKALYLYNVEANKYFD